MHSRAEMRLLARPTGVFKVSVGEWRVRKQRCWTADTTMSAADEGRSMVIWQRRHSPGWSSLHSRGFVHEPS